MRTLLFLSFSFLNTTTQSRYNSTHLSMFIGWKTSCVVWYFQHYKMNKAESLKGILRHTSRTQSPTEKSCWLNNWFIMIQLMIMMIMSEENLNIIIIFAKFTFSFWPFYFFKIIVQLEATSNTTAQSRFKFNLPTDVLIWDEKLVSCLIFSTLQNKHSRV